MFFFACICVNRFCFNYSTPYSSILDDLDFEIAQIRDAYNHQTQLERAVTKKAKKKWSKFCKSYNNNYNSKAKRKEKAYVDCRLTEIGNEDEDEMTVSDDHSQSAHTISFKAEMSISRFHQRKLDRMNYDKQNIKNRIDKSHYNHDDNNKGNYSYSYSYADGCYFFDMIGINVFFDEICKPFLYPNEILNLFVLCKHVRNILVCYDEKCNFLNELLDKNAIINYWLAILDSIEIYQKQDLLRLCHVCARFCFFLVM